MIFEPTELNARAMLSVKKMEFLIIRGHSNNT